jgi:hypothetical protein
VAWGHCCRRRPSFADAPAAPKAAGVPHHEPRAPQVRKSTYATGFFHCVARFGYMDSVDQSLDFVQQLVVSEATRYILYRTADVALQAWHLGTEGL